jgi:hypothetical protein
MSILIKELEAKSQELNKNYSKISFEEWKSETKKIADQVWFFFNSEYWDEKNLDLISLIARSIVFWDDSKKQLTAKKLYTKAMKSLDLKTQENLSSIIKVIIMRTGSNCLKNMPIPVDPNKKHSATLSEIVRLVK